MSSPAAAKDNVQSILERLRNQYLPDLQSLHEECTWLRSNLGLEGKGELQASEARLVQFVNMIDVVIKKIRALDRSDNSKATNIEHLTSLESNIVKMILPVRARLHEKWKQNERERLIHQAANSAVDPAGAAALLSQNPGVLNNALDAHRKPAVKAPVTSSSGLKSKHKNKIGSRDGSSTSKTSINRNMAAASSSSGSNNNQSAAAVTSSASVPIETETLPAQVGRASTPSSSNLTPEVSAAPSNINNNSNTATATRTALPLPISLLPAYSSSALSRGLLRAGIPVSAPHPSLSHISGSSASSGSSSGNLANGNNANTSSSGSGGNNMFYVPRSHVGSMQTFGLPPRPVASSSSQNEQCAPWLTVPAMQVPRGDVSSGSRAYSSGGSYIGGPNNNDSPLGGSSAQNSIALGNLHISTDNLQAAGSSQSPSARLSPFRQQLSAVITAPPQMPPQVPPQVLPPVFPVSGNHVGPHHTALSRNRASSGPSAVHRGGASAVPEEEDDALTANIFDDGCDSVSDFGIYDQSGHCDEFDPMISHDSLCTVPADWRLHNESSHNSYAVSANSHAKPSAKNKRAFSSTQDEPSIVKSEEDAEGAVEVAGEEYVMSARRRRKLSQIVPFPRRPRTAEYQCSVCSDPYQVLVQDNPWWAVYTHECPTCHTKQIPRIDINLSHNAVELDPNSAALYGEGVAGSSSDEEGGEESGLGEEDMDDGRSQEGSCYDNDLSSVERMQVPPYSTQGGPANGSTTGTAAAGLTDAEERLAKDEASKLLVLMCHARTCNGVHSSDKHAEICKSTKYLMLHIRDCKGVDAAGGECAFPWCKPCKKMLRHLTQCYQPASCSICNPWCLPNSYEQLRRMNQLRYCQPVPTQGPAPVHAPVVLGAAPQS